MKTKIHLKNALKKENLKNKKETEKGMAERTEGKLFFVYANGD